MEPSPELALVIACARGRLDDRGTERVRRLLAGPLDWERVIGLALAHTVLPMLRRCLLEHADRVPAAAVSRMAREYVAGATLSGRLADELGRILEVFRAGGVDVLAYKGPALAVQIHGEVQARAFRDLDLIVRPRDFDRARAALLAVGYRAAHEATRTPRALLLRTECDESFVHTGTGVLVELHWAVTPPYLSLPVDVEGLFARKVELTGPGISMPTPCGEDALVLLCINGTKDGWGRIETLAAIAELVRAHPGLRWAQVQASMEVLHARRMWHLALLLAESMMGAEIPSEFSNAARADASLAALASEVGARLFDETTDRLSLFERGSFIVRTRERARDRAAFWLRRALTPSRRDAALVRLPPGLWPVYYAIRPLRLIAERMGRQSRK